jgi:hypothetical protein
MSQHEYEDLVEMSIRALDQSPRAADLELRDVFYTLYELQGMFDTGNTYFRVMPILLKHCAFYRLEPQNYPDAARLEAMFKDSHVWLQSIYQYPTEDADTPDNFVVAYWFFDRNPSHEFRNSGVVDRWDEPRVFVPAESSVIPSLIESGALPASEATPPQRLPFGQVAALVAREAESQGDTDLIAYWYLLLPNVLLFVTEEFGRIQTNPHALEVRRTAERTGADKLGWEYGDLRRASLEELNDLEEEESEMVAFFKWWFRLEG